MANETLQPQRAGDAGPVNESDATGEVKIFSTSGRLGRVRYIAYTVGFSFLFYAIAGIVAGLLAGMSPSGGEGMGALIVVAAGIGILVLTVIWTVRRCHDFNASGWLSLLVFVPLASLIFWFIPGTVGANRFGLKPPPNGGGVIAAACLVPAFFFLGILAAIAIPAYHDYSQRAQIAEAFTVVAGAKLAIAEYVQTNRDYPDGTAIGVLKLNIDSQAGKYVESVIVTPDTGVITVTMQGADVVGSAITNESITFTPPANPLDVGGQITWACTGTVAQKFLPRSCQSTGSTQP